MRPSLMAVRMDSGSTRHPFLTVSRIRADLGRASVWQQTEI